MWTCSPSWWTICRMSSSASPLSPASRPGKAFFGAPIVPGSHGGDGVRLAYQAVPSRETVLLRGERDRLASEDNLGLEAVSLIDDWIIAAAEFVARYEPPPPREAVAHRGRSPHTLRGEGFGEHAIILEVLWVGVDRETHFVGRPGFRVKEKCCPAVGRIHLAHAPGGGARLGAPHSRAPSSPG